MKIRVLVVLFLCMATVCMAAGDVIPSYAFPVPERLTYGLYWGIIRVGTGTLTIDWKYEADGRRLLIATATAQTGTIVSKIFPVDNTIQSFIDPDTMLPVSYYQRINEGRKKREDYYVFDHAVGVATQYDKRGKTNDISIATNTHDLLSFTYSMRNRGMEVGDAGTFTVVVDDKVYDVHLTGEEIERIRIPGRGRQQSLRVQPIATFGEIHNQRGQLWLWFSLDDARQCLRAEGKMPVASVKAILLDE